MAADVVLQGPCTPMPVSGIRIDARNQATPGERRGKAQRESDSITLHPYPDVIVPLSGLRGIVAPERSQLKQSCFLVGYPEPAPLSLWY